MNLDSLKGKKTYLTVALAFGYLIASKYGYITFDQKTFDGFLAAAIAFLRSGVNGTAEVPADVTPTK